MRFPTSFAGVAGLAANLPAGAFPGTEYATAQKTLIRIYDMCAPIALALSLLGAWLL
jgi:hypothetical protein